MEQSLVKVDTAEDILPEYRGTPVADLLAYQNFGRPHPRYTEAALLIGMCMDHRLQLRIPSNFAHVLRCAGANLGKLEFDVSFSIAVGGVRSVCLIGHDGCRMVDLASKRRAFVSGLVDGAGWDRTRAEAHFDEHAPRHGFVDVVEFLYLEAQRLRDRYAGVIVAPFIYSPGDRSLRQITQASHAVAPVSATVALQGGEERR